MQWATGQFIEPEMMLRAAVKTQVLDDVKERQAFLPLKQCLSDGGSVHTHLQHHYKAPGDHRENSNTCKPECAKYNVIGTPVAFTPAPASWV